MAKIKVSELAQLDESNVNKYTSLLAVDNNQSYQLKYGFLSSNLSSNLYRPITETVSVECDIQQQKDDISALSATSNSLCAEIQLSTSILQDKIDTKIGKDISATSDSFGLIKIGYSPVDNNYALMLDEEGHAYVTVEGGSGSDSRVNDLIAISSYYADSKRLGQDNKPKDLIAELKDDISLSNSNFINSISQLSSNIQQLCTDIITGEGEDDSHSLSLDFIRFRDTIAELSANEDEESNAIEITGGILHQIILSDTFAITDNIEANTSKTLTSNDCAKDGYLAIGIQINSYTGSVTLGNRYIDNNNNKSYICIDVKNSTTSQQSVKINGIVTYIHTSKVYNIE